MMWREILAYNASVLVLSVEIIKECAVVHLSDFVYEPKSKCFVVNRQKRQTLQSLHSRNGRTEISCVACKVILDEQCGIFLPYFIAQFNKHCYLFSLDSTNEWLMRYNFMIPKILGGHITLSDTNYSVENGPTLIWVVKNEIFIYKAEYSLNVKGSVDNILKLPVDLPVDKELEATSNILWWKSDNPEEGMIVMKDSEGRNINSYLIAVDNKKRKAHVVLNRRIIPFLYLTITSCAVVISEQSSLIEDHPSDNSYRVFISTMHNQLLEFSHGKYVKHINIPLSSCEKIQIFELVTNHCVWSICLSRSAGRGCNLNMCEKISNEKTPEDSIILLCSEKDQICVVDWINSKILHTYQVFSKLLLDDFIGLGTCQTLLFDDLNHKGCETFVLTDFCKVNVEKSKQDEKDDGLSNCKQWDNKESQSIKSNIDDVVNALMKKVQATEISITECAMEKSEKYSFIIRHCKNFKDMLVNGLTASPILAQISGLGELISGHTRGREDSPVQNSNEKIIVRSKWQEISGTEWIIGVEVENIGLSSVSSMSLCAVNKTGGTLVSSSKIVGSDMQTKKQKAQVLSSSQRATLVAIIALPHFSSDIYCTVNLILIWKHEDNEHVSQFCGVVNLHMEDLIYSAKRKCQYLALYPLKTQLVVSTAHCDISNVTKLLKSNMDVCEHSPSQQYHLRYLPFINHVSWTCTKKAVIMSVFTRDYDELCLCLRLLGQRLPDSLTWSLLGKTSPRELTITAMKKEICFRIHELNNILSGQLVKSDETEDIMVVEESEELPVKRRKISKCKPTVVRSHQTIDSALCRKSFSDISSYVSNTNNGFLALIFLANNHK